MKMRLPYENSPRYSKNWEHRQASTWYILVLMHGSSESNFSFDNHKTEDGHWTDL